MPGATSRWRVNDVVAYDMMRDAATAVIALLHAGVTEDGADVASAREEIMGLRAQVLATDPYDRAAVAALVARLEGWARDLEGRSR